MDGILYGIGIIVFVPIIFHILRATRLEKCFEKGKTLELKAAYIIITLVISHLLASIFVALSHVFDLFQ